MMNFKFNFEGEARPCTAILNTDPTPAPPLRWEGSSEASPRGGWRGFDDSVTTFFNKKLCTSLVSSYLCSADWFALCDEKGIG